MQSLRNGDRPTWGRRADGGGLAGGAAVALAEKVDYTQRQISTACRLPPECAVSLVFRAGSPANLRHIESKILHEAGGPRSGIDGKSGW